MEISFKVHKERNQENAVTTSTDQFPCLAIFLPILEKEYKEEKARSERIDNKAIALLTIIIALITVYVPIFPFKDMIKIYKAASACCIVMCVFSLFLLLGISAIMTAIYSAKKLFDIYKPTVYQAIGIEHLNTNDNLSCNTAHTFQRKLIRHYQSIILANSATNTHKAKVLEKQVKNVIIVFLLLSMSAIGMTICSGIIH